MRDWLLDKIANTGPKTDADGDTGAFGKGLGMWACMYNTDGQTWRGIASMNESYRCRNVKAEKVWCKSSTGSRMWSANTKHGCCNRKWRRKRPCNMHLGISSIHFTTFLLSEVTSLPAPVPRERACAVFCGLLTVDIHSVPRITHSVHIAHIGKKQIFSQYGGSDALFAAHVIAASCRQAN